MEHVCIRQPEIDQLRSEIEQIRKDHTNTREDMIEMKSDLKWIRDTVSSLKISVEKIADEPRQKWAQVQKQVISFVVGGGLIGFVIWAINMAQSYK